MHTYTYIYIHRYIYIHCITLHCNTIHYNYNTITYINRICIYDTHTNTINIWLKLIVHPNGPPKNGFHSLIPKSQRWGFYKMLKCGIPKKPLKTHRFQY